MLQPVSAHFRQGTQPDIITVNSEVSLMGICSKSLKMCGSPEAQVQTSFAVFCLVISVMSDSCDPMDCSLPGSSFCPWDSPGKYSGMDCHALLQGIFPTQGSNPGLPHCRRILYCLSHQGSPPYRGGEKPWSILECK